MENKVGAQYLGDEKVRFRVWAPEARNVKLLIKESYQKALEKEEKGYWSGIAQPAGPGTRYKFELDGKEFPDPASRSQPEGVHSWSEVVTDETEWKDKDWKGRQLGDMIIYELHIGTFTPEGTFEAVLDRLDHLEELGINTIEIMPISQFPGSRNWGYDGVYPFAVQNSYGGVQGLRTLVDGCHSRGFSVILDVVYNHMGPEGNYLAQFGPYFTEKYHTPWGSALNFDDAYSDSVRSFFLQNALMWLKDCHLDGLRLDAVHEIIDRSANHFLKELSLEVDHLEQETGRRYVLIAESDLNDTKLIRDYSEGGFGLEGQWVDDFHHALHTLLTGETSGYYSDYGNLAQLARAYKQGFVYDGRFSEFRKKTVGNSPDGISPSSFVVCIQNHDQVGNRVLGDRLSSLISFEKRKLAAGVVLSAGFVPMLFMGEEYGEDNPFQYFISHGDPALVRAVQEGRRKEFKYFHQAEEDEFPDPQATETFTRSKLRWNFDHDKEKRMLFDFYKEMISLRSRGIFEAFKNKAVTAKADQAQKLLKISTEGPGENLLGLFNFGRKTCEIGPLEGGTQELIIASAAEKWNGELSTRALEARNVRLPSDSFMIFRVKSYQGSGPLNI